MSKYNKLAESILSGDFDEILDLAMSDAKSKEKSLYVTIDPNVREEGILDQFPYLAEAEFCGEEEQDDGMIVAHYTWNGYQEGLIRMRLDRLNGVKSYQIV